MFIRIIAALLLLATMTTWSTRPASACMCIPRDPRDRLETATAAFVGRVVSHVGPVKKRDTWSSADPVTYSWLSSDLVTYTFEVEAAIKGEFGESVEVRSALSSCGFERGILDGARSGLLLRLASDGSYLSGLCSSIDPDIMLDIAEGRSPADGTGQLMFLVVGLLAIFSAGWFIRRRRIQQHALG